MVIPDDISPLFRQHPNDLQGYTISPYFLANRVFVNKHLFRHCPAEHALAANNVAGCQFQYAPGTPTRNAVLSMRLSIAEDGESVTLMEQVSVSNLP